MEPREVLAQLRRIPAFGDLGHEGDLELLRLVPYVQARTFSAGETILTEQHASDRTVIVVTGRVDVAQPSLDAGAESEALGERGPGAVLGRTSLQVDDNEPITAEAAEQTEALILHFRDLVRAYQKSAYLREHLEGPLKPDKLIGTLRTIPLFSLLSDRSGELELYQVAQIVHEQIFGNGEWIFRQGEVSDRLVLVIGGQVSLTATDPEGVTRDVGVLGPGDLTEDTGLLVGDFHDVTATAVGLVRVVYLLRTEFTDLVQRRPYLERRLLVTDDVERRRRVRQFDWLREDEWAIAAIQRHWTRLFRQAAVPTFLVLLLLPAVVTLLTTGQTGLMIIAVLLSVPVIILVGGIAWQYINWHDDFFVITTQRVAHIERAGPFSTQQEETPLDNVVDIYEVQPGLTANLLNYGNLVLQTAGETVNIDMSYVPYPDELRRLISMQIERSKARDVLRTRGQIRELLAHRLEPSDFPQQPARAEPASARTSQPRRFLPAVLFMSVWEYLFPPSRTETDGGDTVIWRRFWLPGFIRSSPALLPFVVLTVGGPWFLSTRFREPAFFGWLVGWLFVEAVSLGILMWFVEDWRNDYFQLTPSHIILVQRLPLLLRESRHEARLDRIQNLGYEVPSIIGKLLDYGHVAFETAGTQGKFELRWARHPEDVQKAISNRQYEYRRRQRQAESDRRQQELLSWFSTYDELHREMDT